MRTRIRDLRDKLVVITGAGSGIGRATAYAFAEAGARVAAVDLDADAARRTAELASLLGAPAFAYTADVSDAAAMSALAEAIEAEHGVPDVLVNNAGVAVAGQFLDTPLEAWRDVLGVNLWGVVHGCHAFGRRMAERGRAGRPGQIVNVASVAAFQPSCMLPAYCTSKAAVLMLSECLRAELAPANVGVTAVCPGLVRTGITRAARLFGPAAQVAGGANGAEDARERVDAFYKRRNFPASGVADAIVRAVREDPPVVSVTPEAQLIEGLARFAPFALRALAGVEALGLGKESR